MTRATSDATLNGSTEPPTQAPPTEVEELARARAAARAERRFSDADALRVRIEASGWKPVDRGLAWTLEPIHPPDVRVGDHVLYGASSSVPSRLAEPDASEATVVVVAEDTEALDRMLAPLRSRARGALQVVAVANGPVHDAVLLDELAAVARETAAEPVWLAAPLTPGACLNAGLRRALGSLVVTLAPGAVATGEIVGPLRAVLAEPSVAVAGGGGLRSRDMRHFTPGPGARPDAVSGACDDVEALDGACLAFRREDLRTLGPLDEGFHGLTHLAVWWCLRLRDRGPGEAPRRAVAVTLPIEAGSPRADEARYERRDHYRLLDAFGRRADLVLPA